MQSSIREIATGGKSREARSQMKRLLQNLQKHAGCGRRPSCSWRPMAASRWARENKAEKWELGNSSFTLLDCTMHTAARCTYHLKDKTMRLSKRPAHQMVVAAMRTAFPPAFMDRVLGKSMERICLPVLASARHLAPHTAAPASV